MKILPILLLSIFGVLSSSKTKLETCEYQDYYQEITNALTEKHTNKNWKKANEIFKSSFKKVKTPYGKDLEEALEVSIKVKDNTQTQYIVQKLLQGGIPASYFTKYPSIIKTEWWTNIDHYLVEKIYEKDYDKELLSKLIALRKQDSLFNVEYHEFRKGENSLELNYLINSAKDICFEFRELVDNYGFPSEINTGYYYKDNKIQDLPLQVILIHMHQLGESLIMKDLSSEDLICSGHLSEFNYNHLKNIRSLGGNKGIEHEMRLFYQTHK